uniref:RIKEN cDNA 4930516K23 gene n=1 Tax=Mus musculus TaxID=10090 RepID=V9GXN4_MOUSE
MGGVWGLRGIHKFMCKRDELRPLCRLDPQHSTASYQEKTHILYTIA